MKKILCMAAICALLGGCGAKTVSTDKFTVYTSFYAMESLTETIAGDKAEVVSLIPSGVEAHDWEPGTADMIALSKADLFIYSGMGMEPWAEKIIDGAANDELAVVEASAGIEPLGTEGVTDPHVWLDPENALRQLENIADALVEADPQNAEYYKANLETARTKIKELDGEFAEIAEKAADKEIIVTHGAFGYLCNAYGLEQYMIEGISGESDPSSAAMRDVIEYLRGKEKRAVFYAAAESDKIARTVADEADAAVYVLNTFESDAAGRDYFEVMRENAEVLREALNG